MYEIQDLKYKFKSYIYKLYFLIRKYKSRNAIPRSMFFTGKKKWDHRGWKPQQNHRSKDKSAHIIN